jgi:DNA-binding MarR family transcriptional regulator
MITISRSQALAAAAWCRKNLDYAEKQASRAVERDGTPNPLKAGDRGFVTGTAKWKDNTSQKQLLMLGAVCSRLIEGGHFRVEDFRDSIKNWKPERPYHEKLREQMEREAGIERPKVVQIGPVQKLQWMIDDAAFGGLTPAKLAILGYLRDLCRPEHDECSASLAEIAKRTGLHTATVKRNLAELDDGRHFERVRSKGGRNQRTVYKGLLKAAEATYGVWRWDSEQGRMVVDRPENFQKQAHTRAPVSTGKPNSVAAPVYNQKQAHTRAPVTADKLAHTTALRNSTIQIEPLEESHSAGRLREPAEALGSTSSGEKNPGVHLDPVQAGEARAPSPGKDPSLRTASPAASKEAWEDWYLEFYTDDEECSAPEDDDRVFPEEFNISRIGYEAGIRSTHLAQRSADQFYKRMKETMEPFPGHEAALHRLRRWLDREFKKDLSPRRDSV